MITTYLFLCSAICLNNKYVSLFYISTLLDEIIPWPLLSHCNFCLWAYVSCLEYVDNMKYLVSVDFYSCKQGINMFHEITFLVKFDLMYFLTFRLMQFLKESLLVSRNWPIIIEGMVCALSRDNWAYLLFFSLFYQWTKLTWSPFCCRWKYIFGMFRLPPLCCWWLGLH